MDDDVFYSWYTEFGWYADIIGCDDCGENYKNNPRGCPKCSLNGGESGSVYRQRIKQDCPATPPLRLIKNNKTPKEG